MDSMYDWVTTPCAPIFVVEERVVEGTLLQKLQQAHEGIILEGWLAKPVLRSVPSRVPPVLQQNCR